MTKRGTVGLVGALLMLGCGGLSNGIGPAACDPILQTAINAKCTGADAVTLTCVAMTKSTAKLFEKADIDTCASNVTNASDCTNAKGVTCKISYTE